MESGKFHTKNKRLVNMDGDLNEISSLQNKTTFYSPLSTFHFPLDRGFTLVELVITVTVLTVLALATIPLVQNAVRRQKEQRLRETLREIRLAIDEFRRDANGPCTANQMQGGQGGAAFQGAQGFSNPRQRVSISDCKIFEASEYNPDRFPPTLDVLVEGVEVIPRNQPIGGNAGGVFGDPNGATGKGEATAPKKKVYLRELPIDPITGKSDWKLRSSIQDKDADWDNNHVWDVRSSAEGETLDGIKYGDL